MTLNMLAKHSTMSYIPALSPSHLGWATVLLGLWVVVGEGIQAPHIL